MSTRAEIADLGNGYEILWPDEKIRILIEYLSKQSNGLIAEATIQHGESTLCESLRINLNAEPKTKSIAKKVHECDGQFLSLAKWAKLIEETCVQTLRRYRVGEPIVALEPAASACVPFLLNPVVYQDHQTLLYAPGGTCKSYLALWLALLVCHGASQANVAGVKSAVLYLDWELNKETVGGRLRALQNAHPQLSQVRPYYRRCELPLHQEVHVIAAHVKAHQVKLVIVDSAAMACGAELSSPEAAINLQRALRKIGCASLVLAHVAKNTQEGQEKTAYGTVFFRELARNVWEVTKADNPNPVHLALAQTKNNFGPKHDALGLSLTFSDEQVRIEAQDLTAEPEFQSKLPTPAQIRNFLEDGTPRTARAIAEGTGLKLPTVSSALSRDKGRKWQMIGGQGQDTLWCVLKAK
jgi:hypothetical protein